MLLFHSRWSFLIDGGPIAVFHPRPVPEAIPPPLEPLVEEEPFLGQGGSVGFDMNICQDQAGESPRTSLHTATDKEEIIATEREENKEEEEQKEEEGTEKKDEEKPVPPEEQEKSPKNSPRSTPSQKVSMELRFLYYLYLSYI